MLVERRVASLLFVDDVVLFASSSRIQLHRSGSELRVKRPERRSALLRPGFPTRKKVESSLRIGDESLPQAEEFKCLGIFITSDGRLERRIGPSSELMRALLRSVGVKKELSHKAKLSIYWSRDLKSDRKNKIADTSG